MNSKARLVGLCLSFVILGYGTAAWHVRNSSVAKQTGAHAATTVLADLTKTLSPKTYRVGLQAGHWENEDLPDELSKLYWSTGTSAGGYDEWQVNLEIANDAAAILRQEGVIVDVLPATIPEGYQADAFVAIHADGNDDPGISGYKVAASQWSPGTGAEDLSQDLGEAYADSTGMAPDSALAISQDMTEYYAFNYIKYRTAINPQTPGALIETGYLTNPADRDFLTESTQKAARGIADGILKYLNGPTP